MRISDKKIYCSKKEKRAYTRIRKRKMTRLTKKNERDIMSYVNEVSSKETSS